MWQYNALLSPDNSWDIGNCQRTWAKSARVVTTNSYTHGIKRVNKITKNPSLFNIFVWTKNSRLKNKDVCFYWFKEAIKKDDNEVSRCCGAKPWRTTSINMISRPTFLTDVSSSSV